ncbi:MAG: hypothetical protein V3R16_09990, partial [Nitrospirales bacterium]
GQAYDRGIPRTVDARTALLLGYAPFAPHFLLSESNEPLVPTDPRLVAVFPEDAPCVWQGHFAFLTGPFWEAADDDHHVYRRGIPLEICSKTLTVLNSEPYAGHFAITNRAGVAASGSEVSCDPGGACC